MTDDIRHQGLRDAGDADGDGDRDPGAGEALRQWGAAAVSGGFWVRIGHRLVRKRRLPRQIKPIHFREGSNEIVTSCLRSLTQHVHCNH